MPDESCGLALQSWVVDTGKSKTEQPTSSVEGNFPNYPNSLAFDN